MAEKLAHSTLECRLAVLGTCCSMLDHGESGVGKSSLCSRFIHPGVDTWQELGHDHSHWLSQTDFSEAEINGDHFVYFGAAKRLYLPRGSNPLRSAVELRIHVVEHTTFIDDSRGCPFPGAENYADRATSPTIHVRSSTMVKHPYTCRSRLGQHTPHTQSSKLLSAACSRELGPFPKAYSSHGEGVDGYLFVLDPSKSSACRQCQWKVFTHCWRKIPDKKKKHGCAIVLTKCDLLPNDFDLNGKNISIVKLFQGEAPTGTGSQTASAQTFQDCPGKLAISCGKHQVPVFLASAECCYGVDMPFVYLAHRTLKVFGRPSLPMTRAQLVQIKQRKQHEMLRSFNQFLKRRVTEHRITWSNVWPVDHDDETAERTREMWRSVLGSAVLEAVFNSHIRRIEQPTNKDNAHAPWEHGQQTMCTGTSPRDESDHIDYDERFVMVGQRKHSKTQSLFRGKRQHAGSLPMDAANEHVKGATKARTIIPYAEVHMDGTRTIHRLAYEDMDDDEDDDDVTSSWLMLHCPDQRHYKPAAFIQTKRKDSDNRVHGNSLSEATQDQAPLRPRVGLFPYAHARLDHCSSCTTCIPSEHQHQHPHHHPHQHPHHRHHMDSTDGSAFCDGLLALPLPPTPAQTKPDNAPLIHVQLPDEQEPGNSDGQDIPCSERSASPSTSPDCRSRRRPSGHFRQPDMEKKRSDLRLTCHEPGDSMVKTIAIGDLPQLQGGISNSSSPEHDPHQNHTDSRAFRDGLLVLPLPPTPAHTKPDHTPLIHVRLPDEQEHPGTNSDGEDIPCSERSVSPSTSPDWRSSGHSRQPDIERKRSDLRLACHEPADATLRTIAIGDLPQLQQDGISNSSSTSPVACARRRSSTGDGFHTNRRKSFETAVLTSSKDGVRIQANVTDKPKSREYLRVEGTPADVNPPPPAAPVRSCSLKGTGDVAGKGTCEQQDDSRDIADKWVVDARSGKYIHMDVKQQDDS
ncbi:uncharacterized protein LOC135830348 [Sycon ciliatum]|uniref:uncharacterized protein LOC135830348 n=1 Tax=Sycon ciliatum TaxID=27933 RepID=UPI0031F666F0